MRADESRRDAIREILARAPVTTQAELRRRLGARGIRASQATLSRDMAALRVVRAVVRTKASAASTVARALDEAGLTEVLGTLAGDDTVFVAPRRVGGGQALARRLRGVLGLGS